MKNKNPIISVTLIIILLILAWSPWITKNYVENIVNKEFNAEWVGVLDGCGLIEITNPHRTLFGYNVQIKYACGMLPPDSPEFHRVTSVYISSISSIHGLPRS